MLAINRRIFGPPVLATAIQSYAMVVGPDDTGWSTVGPATGFLVIDIPQDHVLRVMHLHARCLPQGAEFLSRMELFILNKNELLSPGVVRGLTFFDGNLAAAQIGRLNYIPGGDGLVLSRGDAVYLSFAKSAGAATAQTFMSWHALIQPRGQLQTF